MGRRLLIGWMLLSFAWEQTLASSTSSAPWQVSHFNVLDEKTWGDLPPTIFAPGGRLYAVERTVKAASSAEDKSSNLVVMLQCRDGVVAVSSSPLSPHLHAQTFSPQDAKVSNNVTANWTSSLWFDEAADTASSDDTTFAPQPFSCFSGVLLATGGNAVHAALLRRRLQSIAESMHESYDGGQGLSIPWISSSSMARRVADNLQLVTQTVGGRAGRMLASSALIVGHKESGVDNDSSDFPFSIWRVDPTGQFWDCDAAAVGRASGVAESHLLRLISQNDKNEQDTVSNVDVQSRLSSMSTKEALSIACQCIVEALKLPKDKGDDDNWKHMKGVLLQQKREPLLDLAIGVWSGKELFQNYLESDRDN